LLSCDEEEAQSYSSRADSCYRERLLPRGFESPTQHIEKFPELRTRLVSDKPLDALSADDVDGGLRTLTAENARVFAGLDADGNKIFRRKGNGRRSGATLNRYLVALGALYTWARRERLLPRGFESPTRHIEKFPESRGRVRFLSDAERERLLTACRAAPWPRLYLLVLMRMRSRFRRATQAAQRF